MTLQVYTQKPLDAALMQRLSHVAAGHKTLEQALEWSMLPGSSATIGEIIAQDEFTHDMIVSFEDDLYLVYDMT